MSMATGGDMAFDWMKSTPSAVNHSCSAAVSVRLATVCMPSTRAICTTAVMAACDNLVDAHFRGDFRRQFHVAHPGQAQ